MGLRGLYFIEYIKFFNLARFLLVIRQDQESTMPSMSYATVSAPRTVVPKYQPIEVIAKDSKSEAGAFETLVDAFNPLQQIPGVGQAYRKVSGDKSSNGAQLAGHVAIGAALGGPIGAGIGAGVFVLEKALPGVFNAIGKLFSSGKNSDSPADMPNIIGERKSSAATPHRPLIEGLDVRPGSKPARAPQPKIGQAATPNMSMAQFEALMQSIGAQPVDTATAPAKANNDVAALIQSNLDKYRRQQAQISTR
jgi:hypothetical protein